MAKKVCLYGILAAVCMVIGYIEHFISFDFIAPGIKIGLANSVAIILIKQGRIKGAYAVNIVRILLSALLFSAPSTLIFSLSGGILSMTVMCILSRFNAFSIVGFSIAGAVTHNIAQLLCAALLLGNGVWYYLPFLLIAALLSGTLTGIFAKIVIKKIK